MLLIQPLYRVQNIGRRFQQGVISDGCGSQNNNLKKIQINSPRGIPL
jgi:hypothetical protein